MDEMDEGPRKDNSIAKLFGAILMAVGAMITFLCGLCSLTILAAGGGAGAFPIVAVIGGIPTFIGVLVFRAGLKRYKENAAS